MLHLEGKGFPWPLVHVSDNKLSFNVGATKSPYKSLVKTNKPINWNHNFTIKWWWIVISIHSVPSGRGYRYIFVWTWLMYENNSKLKVANLVQRCLVAAISTSTISTRAEKSVSNKILQLVKWEQTYDYTRWKSSANTIFISIHHWLSDLFNNKLEPLATCP